MTKNAKIKHFVLNMLVSFVLICGIVLERKKLSEIEKVSRNWKSCLKVAKHLVDSLISQQVLYVVELHFPTIILLS